jgi:hypothetical protein
MRTKLAGLDADQLAAVLAGNVRTLYDIQVDR